MFIRSLGLRLGQKQQIIQAQVQHDWTDDYIPEDICGVWLKYLLPVILKGGSTEPLEPPLATGMSIALMTCSSLGGTLVSSGMSFFPTSHAPTLKTRYFRSTFVGSGLLILLPCLDRTRTIQFICRVPWYMPLSFHLFSGPSCWTWLARISRFVEPWRIHRTSPILDRNFFDVRLKYWSTLVPLPCRHPNNTTRY